MLSSTVSPSLAYSKAKDESNDSYLLTAPLPAVANGKLSGFVLLPSDPHERLTSEQLDALFPKANRAVFMRELLRLVQAAHAEVEAAS